MPVWELTSEAKGARRNTRYQLWDVKCLKEGQRMFLKNLDNKGAITINTDNNESVEVMVDGNRVMQLDKLLRERGIYYDVLASDAFGTTGSLSPRRMRNSDFIYRSRSSLKRTLDWKDFYPLDSVYNFMDDLEKSFPSTCTVSVIGKTVEGRDLKLLKISNSNANNTGIWLDATIHAREWISTAVVTYLANYIARNFGHLPKVFTNYDWYFMPVVNPDGYNFTHTTDRMWRKNRSRIRHITTGVDLNRNFGYYWGQSVNDNTTSDPSSINYRGPEAFSEPETIAIKDIILYSRTPFKIFLTFHSCSELISFPWCHTSDPCPDYVSLLEGGTCMAKAIYETNGRMYKVGNFKDIMYAAAGTSIDWSYGTAHIPFSYLIELRSKKERFLLPKEEILDCCRETLNGLMALVRFVDQKKCYNCTVITKSPRL